MNCLLDRIGLIKVNDLERRQSGKYLSKNPLRAHNAVNLALTYPALLQFARNPFRVLGWHWSITFFLEKE